ncbi:MAG: sigma-54-dependent Fis family transcriptional regulator [Rhizobiales bacterium]|nr:sigma-54-dependent Fis family transcriptional regulator [Hyphomicrobiales bacterium]
MASDILIVDDESDIRDLISGILEDEGFETRVARDSDSALQAIDRRMPSLLVLDIWLQGSRLDGLELLDVVKKKHPELPVVIISGHGNIETAVAAIKRGAYDYIEKPFNSDRLILIVTRALETTKLKRENEELREQAGFEDSLVGSSLAMSQLRQSIKKVAPTNSRILISGAPGTGKELAARLIHSGSTRFDGPFIAINAAAMAPERVEIELFGTENETGDTPRKVGALEQAHRGTLYLDEVGEMPSETQTKVLRVLVDQSFERVGGAKKVNVDVRVISSTSRDLRRDIDEGRFREDLYHRLAVVPVRMPSMAERREDIQELISHFMHRIARTSGLPAREIGEDALAVLQAHDWPGNVRQLRNNVERLMILAGGEPEAVITADMLPSEVGAASPPDVNGSGGEQLMALPLRDARELFERHYLEAQIARFGGNISRTASFIGMERSALHRKLKSLGLGQGERTGGVQEPEPEIKVQPA